MMVKFPRLFVIGSGIGVVIGGSVLLKDSLVGKGQTLPTTVRGDGKVCIITGTNTGIGKETAKELAKRGCTVYMACRNLEKCREARLEIISESLNKKVFCRECDLADFNSIRSFVKGFQRKENRLDILINNAGVMRCPRTVTKQGIEMQLGVNHMGHFLLTNLLLENLKAAAPSRIINISSTAHRSGTIQFDDLNSEKSYDSGKAYNQSKLANILFTNELAERLKGTGVTANAVHPGIVRTDLTRHMGFEDSIMASIFVKPLLSFFLKSPVQGSLTSIYVALEPTLEDVTGKYFSECKETQPTETARDSAVAKKLWKTSEKWTALHQDVAILSHSTS